MDHGQAQVELNNAFAGGSAGVLVSGLVWLATSVVWFSSGLNTAFLILFAGGMMIHPASLFLCRVALRCPPASASNPLNRLAMESTVTLMAGIAIAYVLLHRQPTLAIPSFAAIMGARYFIFRTLYESIVYWILGGFICAIATLGLLGAVMPTGNIALIIGGAEIAFAIMVYSSWQKIRRQAGG
mgnify:CR=1 FL=1